MQYRVLLSLQLVCLAFSATTQQPTTTSPTTTPFTTTQGPHSAQSRTASSTPRSEAPGLSWAQQGPQGTATTTGDNAGFGTTTRTVPQSLPPPAAKSRRERSISYDRDNLVQYLVDNQDGDTFQEYHGGQGEARGLFEEGGAEEQLGSNDGYLSLWPHPHPDQARRSKGGKEEAMRDQESVLQSAAAYEGRSSSTATKKRSMNTRGRQQDLYSSQLKPQVGKRRPGESSQEGGQDNSRYLQAALQAVESDTKKLMLVRQHRAGRMYDVPQIECPNSPDHTERFACPRPDRRGRFRCIDDRALCDGFYDCPGKEDESPEHCLFYKTTKAHLDILAEALLRWARGR